MKSKFLALSTEEKKAFLIADLAEWRKAGYRSDAALRRFTNRVRIYAREANITTTVAYKQIAEAKAA